MSTEHSRQVRGADSLVGQYVIFTIADTELAVPMTQVEEILKPTKVVRVPLAPSSVLGVSNLRGTVLPIVSVHIMFGLEHMAMTKAQRTLVLNIRGHQIGFVVESVKQVIYADKEQISTDGIETGLVNDDQLLGMIKLDNGAINQILNFDAICDLHLKSLMSTEARSFNESKEVEQVNTSTVLDQVQLISFTVQGQEFALPITDAKEIVNFPRHVSKIPNSPAHLVGLMTLRSRVMALISLRNIFGLPESKEKLKQRVLVIPLKNGSQNQIGLIVDDLKEVVRVNRELIDEVPSVMSGDGMLNDISDICRLDDGKRLISIIDTKLMLEHHLIKQAIHQVDDLVDGNSEEEGDEMDDRSARTDGEQYIVFRLGNDEFGVKISSAKEIVRLPEKLTQVPNAPSFVEGIINLRGEVLPVVSKRVRFGLSALERNERQRIVVYQINGHRVGFIVDSVSEVLRIANQDIREAPQLHVASDARNFISSVANLEKDDRMIILIDSDRLLEPTEKSKLLEFAGD